MYVYLGFDDTDTIDADQGTGKLARWFERELPVECRLWGVVRQQLLVDDAIPYTSHNSSACAVVQCPDGFRMDTLVAKAISHVELHAIPGSDPGVCLCASHDTSLEQLIDFGLRCAGRIVTQKEALQSAKNVHLSGHGGTNDGIIGAAAAVGLTAYGWCGRFIEFGRLRDFPSDLSVGELERSGMKVVSIDRDAHVPLHDDVVHTNGWLRPRLLGGKPVLSVFPKAKKLWQTVGEKRQKEKKEG